MNDQLILYTEQTLEATVKDYLIVHHDSGMDAELLRLFPSWKQLSSIA